MTKKQLEEMVRKVIKEEESYNPNSKEYKLKFLQDIFKSLYQYSKNKEMNLDADFIIRTCNNIIKQMQVYKNNKRD